MAGLELKAGVAYRLGIVLIDTANRPAGKTKVEIGNVNILMRAYGNVGWSTKSLAAGDWVEIGNGIYQVLFSAADLGTSGEFDYLVQPANANSNFDTYRGNVYLPAYHSQDIYDILAGIGWTATDNKTSLASLLLDIGFLSNTNDTNSNDMGTVLDALLGDKVMDKTVSPWGYLWKTRAGGTLQDHNYSRSVTTESKVKK